MDVNQTVVHEHDSISSWESGSIFKIEPLWKTCLRYNRFMIHLLAQFGQHRQPLHLLRQEGDGQDGRVEAFLDFGQARSSSRVGYAPTLMTWP
jgi:hypothetical protein